MCSYDFSCGLMHVSMSDNTQLHCVVTKSGWLISVIIVKRTAVHIWQEAQLSPRDPHDALYQLKYCPTVVRITQTDRVSAWGALSATATFYCATCVVLYTHRIALGTTIAQQACNAVSSTDFRSTNLAELDRNCDQPTSTATNVTLPAHHDGRKPPWRMDTKVSNSKSDL